MSEEERRAMDTDSPEVGPRDATRAYRNSSDDLGAGRGPVNESEPPSSPDIGEDEEEE